MQFGVFTIGDITPDPTTGTAPTEHQRIKDTARRDIAIGLLRDQRLSAVTVAERLGFSDPSAFHRSFRRWTGRSPGQFR